MKRLFLLIIIAVPLLSVLSCKGYGIKEDMRSRGSLKTIETAGLLLRLDKNSLIPREEYEDTLGRWLPSYDGRVTLKMFTKKIESLSGFTSYADRFYQISDEKDFLKYKTLGMITTTVQRNREELKAYMSEEGVDGIFIYEVDGGYYPQMGFMSFNTVLAFLDANLDIRYMDHSKSYFEVRDFDGESARKHYLDRVSNRLLTRLAKLNLIEQKKF
jgi:hypothetical protein